MKEAIKHIKQYIEKSPSIGIVLGSGLNKISNSIENKIIIPYSEIPSFQCTSVEGHPGELIIGTIHRSEKLVVFANGRFHLYEGLHYDDTSMIINLFSLLGCKAVIITNSSGCLEKKWKPGDLMITDSHIDMTFRESSYIKQKKYGHSYYNSYLLKLAESQMKNNKIVYHFGTYGWTLGPTYETISEIQMMKKQNIHAVGMSTVPEIERAHQLHIPLLSIACLTNYAVGISKNPLTHEEVVCEAERAGKKFSDLIVSIIKEMDLSKVHFDV